MGELATPTFDYLAELVDSLDHQTIASWATRGALPPIGGSLSPGRSVALERVWLDRSGVPAGYVSLYNYSRINRCVWFAALLAPARRRRIDFYLMCSAFLRLGFAEFEISRVLCEIPKSNLSVLRGIERFGFERVAYLRDHDFQDGIPEDVAIFHADSGTITNIISRWGPDV